MDALETLRRKAPLDDNCLKNSQLKNSQLKKQKLMNKNSIWGKVLNILITVLTAIATTFTTTSCIDVL